MSVRSGREDERRVRLSPSIELTTPAYQERTLLGFELHGPPAAPEEPTSIGEITDVMQVGDQRYFLIDSRHWTFGSRRLVPTWAVSAIDLVDRVCETEMTHETIRRAPDFDPFRLTDPRYLRVLRNVFRPGTEADG